jgi:N-acetylmuramoyl-L-alanine amidase
MIMAGGSQPRNAKAAKTALLSGLCAVCVLSSVVRAAPVRTMYNDALAREQTVRTAMSAAGAQAAVLADVHAVVARYEAVVAHYPASGYSDDALWQAGRLSLDAFAQFGQARDKDAGVRLLKRLAVAYPTSKFAKQVPDQLARADANASGGHTSPPLQATEAPAGRASSAAGADPHVGPSLKNIATIKDIRRAVLPDAIRITIELDAEVTFHDERIADPDRVFVDLPGTRATPALTDQTLRFDSDAEVVRQVRIGRHPNNTTRVVLDAAGVTSYSVYPLYGPYRLVIDCVRPKTTTIAAAITPLASHATLPAAKVAVAPLRLHSPAPVPLTVRRLPAERLQPMPGLSPQAAHVIADALVVTAIADTTAPAPPPLPVRRAADAAPALAGAPTKNATGGFSMARQLGLGVSRIVIDAGHGGHDPGAKGKGITEAELVLDVSLRLEKLLQKVPGVEVILTRSTDDFIPLPERTAIANREGADLFLSIHANASTNPQARGIETYFLNFATNTSAAAVAARENANSAQAMGSLPDFVKAIALNNKLDESRDFAADVQRAMFERLKGSNKTLKNLGVKQAPFVVLIGAAMPSVLAEISFVTNAQEAKLLKSTAYRQRIAEALFNAIRKYQTSLTATTTVALQ